MMAFLKSLFPQKSDCTKEKIRKFVVLTALVLFLFSGTFLLVNEILVRKDQSANRQFQKSYIRSGNDPETQRALADILPSLAEQSPEIEEFYTENPRALVDFAPLLAINPDTVGWIRVGETGIDYPVFQGSDNSYYLKHNGNREYSRSGSVFMDHRIQLQPEKSPDVTILYAHNMESSGDYFEKLTNYSPWETGLDYYRETPVISFDTLYEQAEWKIFGVVYCNVDEAYGQVFHYPDKLQFCNISDFYQYTSEVLDRSLIQTEVDLQYGDSFLVLSTCYFPIQRQVNGRIVIYARKVRPGESPEVDTAKAAVNPDPLLFQYYYESQGGSYQGGSWNHDLLRGYDQWHSHQPKDAT